MKTSHKTILRTRCLQCSSLATRRGCCLNCYQRVRRAVLAGTLTWELAVKRKLVLNPGKHGPRSRYAS